MSLIHEINGDMLYRLSGVARSARSSGNASGGFSSSANATTVIEGLEKGAEAFSRSMLRLDDAISDVAVARSSLSQLSSISSDLLEISRIAADGGTSEAERSRLNSKMKTLVSQFSDAQEESQIGDDVNLLEKDDVKDLLEEAGVNFDETSVLVKEFNGSGGSDGELGFEKTTMPNGSREDPMSQSLLTLSDAQDALVVFQNLEEHVSEDFESVSTILDELKSARAFATYGYQAFDVLGQGQGSLSVDELATEIVDRIRRNTADAALAAHSDIDSLLVDDLMSEDI